METVVVNDWVIPFRSAKILYNKAKTAHRDLEDIIASFYQTGILFEETVSDLNAAQNDLDKIISQFESGLKKAQNRLYGLQ